MASFDSLRSRIAAVLPPDEIDPFFQALERLGDAPRKSIRFNPLRPDAKEFWLNLGLPLGDSIPWFSQGHWIDAECLQRPEAELFLAAGMGYVQEASAMEVVEALDLAATDLSATDTQVLDLCAAPGGKSTQIGEVLRGNGWLVSNEVDRDRVRVLDSLLLRQGVSCSTVYSLFSRDLAEKFPKAFDRILVDAPCSSESFFAKRNERRDDVSHSEVRRCAKKQSKLLEDAVRMAKAGAILVYSTCTYSRNENEDVIEGFLKAHPEWSLLRTGRRFPHRDGVPGGFFAVLRAPESTPGSPADAPSGSRWPRSRGTEGLLREGLRRWNGEDDLYGRIMAADQESPAAAPGLETLPSLELDTAAALEFCRGSLRADLAEKLRTDPQRFTWQGRPIGGAFLRDGKVQLILPKSLRAR